MKIMAKNRAGRRFYLLSLYLILLLLIKLRKSLTKSRSNATKHFLSRCFISSLFS